MATIGAQLFGLSPERAAQARVKRFWAAAYDILKRNPDQTDDEVANAMFDWFEPGPLTIGEPIEMTVSWNRRPVRYRDKPTIDAYLYEARLRLDGPKERWRLCGGISRRFRTRVSFTKDYVRLRAFLESGNGDRFRELIAEELDQARELVATQGAAIRLTRMYTEPHVHHLVGNYSFEDIRLEAREFRERMRKG